MDAPTSTGIPTQPAPLKPWKQVAEESNIFSLPPEQRLAEYDKWSSQVVSEGIKNGDFDSPDTFDQFKLKDIRTRKNLASDDIVGPSDDEVVADYNAFKGAFASTQAAFAADKPTPQDEAIQGEVLQGKRKSAFVRGQMVFNPAVVNDPQKYREAILESDAPTDIKMLYAGLRPEMEKSATVTRRRELANNVITRDVADKVVTAIQEGTELFAANIGTPQSPALKKNKDGIWSVVDPEYVDQSASMLDIANARYNPLGDSQYKPLAAINEYQQKYGLTDEQVQQDYMESLIENAPTSVNRWFGKATSIEDYVKQLDSTVRVKNKDVAPEVRVQDPNLFFDPEGYNAAVDKAKAPDEAKNLAKEARTQFADAVSGDIYNNLLNNRDDFREEYAKDVVDRKDMEKAITRYYKDKKDQAWYDDVGEMFGQAGTALTQGGMNLIMMPSAIKGMFGSVEDAEDVRLATMVQAGEMQAEEAVANRTGGAGFVKLNNDVMRIIPDLAVQMGLAVGTGWTLSGTQAAILSARTGIGKAAAKAAIQQAAITGEKAALKSQLLKIIPDLAGSAVDDVAEEALKMSARAMSNNPLKGGVGTQRAIGSAYAGLTSASSTFGQVYTDVRKMGKSPEEAIGTARAAGIVAGAITSGLTHSFGMLGKGGVEDFASMGRKAGEFTIKDIVNAGLADSLSTPEGRQLIRNIAKGFGKDALSEGAEEGLDQALNLISQYATNPSPEAQNRKATDIINESLYATLLGGIAGGGAFTVGQARATAPGITAQQMQQEILGAQEPAAPDAVPQIPAAPVAPVSPTIQPSVDPVVQEAKDTVESLADIPNTSQTAAALSVLVNSATFAPPENNLPEIKAAKPAPEVQPEKEPVAVQPEPATPEVAPANAEETSIEPTSEPAKVEPEPTENMKTARDTTKPEQMTPEEYAADNFAVAKQKFLSSRGEKEGRAVSVIQAEYDQAKIDEEAAKKAVSPYITKDGKGIRKGQETAILPFQKTMREAKDRREVLEKELRQAEKLDRDLAIEQRPSTQTREIGYAVGSFRPVSSAAVDAYSITLPSGYVKQGELYVYQPEQKEETPVKEAPAKKPAKAKQPKPTKQDAVQEPSPDASVLRQEGQEVGLPEVDQGGRGAEQKGAGQEGEVKAELTPEQNDVVVFVDIENDTEKAVVAAEKKKRMTPGKARKVGIAKQIDRLGITSNDPDSVIAALEKIAAKPPQKHHGRIAKDLLFVLKDSGVKILLVSGNDARMAKHDSRVNGWYDPAKNTAYINLDGPHELGIEETILHELVHASGEKVIQNPQTDAQKRILADLEKQADVARVNAIALGQARLNTKESDLGLLIEMAAGDSDYSLFDILYGVSSLSEYHAHATTSRSFQKFLATYKEGGKRSLFERFINGITSLLSGKKTVDGSDAEKAYAALLDLMREGKGDVRLSNADAVQSRARGRFDLVDAVRAASSGDASTPFQALNEAINANTELTRRIQAESERRSRAYARGKGAILEQIIRSGNTGRLPEEAIKPITDFVNSVSPQALADTRISLSAKPQNSTFDFVDSLVTLALNGMGSEPGEIDRTAIHEFWHGLSRFIPDNEIEKIRKDYVAAVKEYISENPWFVPFIGRTHLSEAQYDDLSRMLSKEEMDAIPWKNWETLEDGRRIRGLKWTKENYRLFRLDEWVAETMADLVRRKQERPTTFLGKMARLLRDFIDTLKQALGNPYLKALDAMTVPDEAFDAQIERFGPIEDNPPVMYGGEGVGINNQFVESKARGIVSDTVTKFAPEFNVVDDKDGPSVFFDGRNVTVNPDALENLDEYEVKDLSERAVVAAKAAPKDPIAASIIQQTDGYSAYNFDSVARKEIRKSLAKAHAVAAENGMAPLAMDLGAKLFEYGGATDADVRKSMANDAFFGERATYTAEPDTKRYSLPRGGELVGPATFSIKAFHGTPKKVDSFSMNYVGAGEGTQFEGYGLYFAGQQKIGEWYRDNVASNNGELLRSALDFISQKTGGDPTEDYGYSNDGDYITLAESLGWKPPEGNLYTVELYVEEGDFLDWDKPLGEQSEKVKRYINQQFDGLELADDFWEQTGEDFMQSMRDERGDKEASKSLLLYGIKGVRYLDGMSRKAGDGSFNYVIFDDKLIKILEENGTPVPQSRARGTEGVVYVPTKRSAPRLAVAKFFAGFRSRGMVTEDAYEIFRNSDAYKREIASFISFIGKDFSNVANKHFGEGEENWLSYRIFSRDATGEVTVSKTGFKTAKEAESFATLNRIKDYTVATGEDLMNRALGSNGPTLSENVREKIEQLTKKGLDDIAKSIAAYKEEYLDYWNLVMLETPADMVDAKQIATLRERKQQWMKALQLRAAEQRQIVDDARKEAVRVALEEGTNRIIAQQQFAKSYLPDDLVHQIERSRAKIDELSGRLTKIEWLMDGSQLQIIIDAKTGVYVTRSYEAFETNDRVGYVNWLDEAYRALYDPKQDYDPLAKERIMPLVRHLKNNIIERRIEDLKLENEQRQVDEIMADLMTDPRQVTQVEMVPGQSTEGTEYEELVRAVAKRELLRRRSEEKRDFIRRAMRSLALNGFASNIGNARKRATALRKEANRLYDQRYPEQVAVAGIMGAPNALRYTLMTDDEAHDIANTERAISENPGSVNGSKIWTASISGTKHSSFYAAVNDDFRRNLDFITGAPSSKTGFSGATANDWKRLGDKILEHKNDVPAFLRTFLGERDNPLLRVSDTLLKQSHLIAVGELFQNLSETGQREGWLVNNELRATDAEKYKGWDTLLTSEQTDQGYEGHPFKGLYADPVMADAIRVMLAANQPSNFAFKAIAKIVGFSLWGVTAGSVKAIIRNLLSAPSFLLNSGFLATILDPRRLRSTAQNVALASIVMQESMSSVAKVSGGKKIEGKALKGLDWVWTGLLTIAASQRTATGVMKGVGTVGEFISQMEVKPTSEAAQQFYSLAVRFGVANDNVEKEAMERLLSLEETISRQPKDKNLGRFAKALKLDGVVGFGSYLLGTIKSAGQQRSQLYGAPDDFTKILAWLNEMDSQARIHAKDTAQYKEWKGADGLFTNMPENLVKLAADHTTDTIQSHSKVWAHITQFKKAGFGVLLAPFVAARAEFYRNAINAYRIGFQELRSENGKERSYGAMRIASAFLAHTVYAKAAGIALSMIFKAMADDDDVAEDSPEKREAIRKLGPEYAKNKNATYVVYKNGTFDWLDISFSDPFSFVSSSLNAARRGIDEKAVDDHVAWSVAKELMAENFGTFVSPQIAVGASATMISGYDPVRGIKIWDSQADTTAEKVQKAITYYAKQAGTPGDIKSAMNIIKAARGIEENGRQYKLGTEIGGVFLGASVRTIKVTDMVEQKLAQAKDNLNTRVGALYEAQLRDSNDVDMDDVVAATETYHRVGQDAIRRMQKVWKAGETLLSDTPGGQKMLNAVMESDKVKMNAVTERAIKTGKNVPSTLSPQTEQKVGDLGNKHGDDRLPVTKDTLKRLNQKP